MKKYLTLTMILYISTYSQAQTIEKFSIDSGGASITVGGIEVLYTIGEVNVQEITTGTILISEGFISSSLSNTLGINDVGINDENIVVYPNPTSDFIYIKTNLSLEKIELYDALGKNILKAKNIKKIPVNNLSKGIYILKIYSGNKSISKKVIIK